RDTAGTTFKSVVPDARAVLAAVIVEVPAVRPDAMPAFARIVAVAVVPEVQVTAADGGAVVPSLRRKRAVKSSTPPVAMVGFTCTIFTATGTGTPPVPTVSVTFGATIAPNVAEICAVPFATPVARPVFAPIVAEAAGNALQVTCV